MSISLCYWSISISWAKSATSTTNRIIRLKKGKSDEELRKLFSDVYSLKEEWVIRNLINQDIPGKLYIIDFFKTLLGTHSHIFTYLSWGLLSISRTFLDQIKYVFNSNNK